MPAKLFHKVKDECHEDRNIFIAKSFVTFLFKFYP